MTRPPIFLLMLVLLFGSSPLFARGTCYNVVAHYNADPTGTNDAYQAIRNAIDAATADPESEVCIPAGRYKIANTHTGTLFPLDENIVVRGAGRDVTEIFYDGTPGALVEVFVISAGKSATIRDLKLTGISDPNNPVFRAARHAGTSGRVTYESVWMTYVYEALKTDPGDGMEISIRNSEFGNIKSTGYLGLQSGSGVGGNVITIENNYFHDIGPMPTPTIERPALYINMPVRKLLVHGNTFDTMGNALTNNGGTGDESGPIIFSNNRIRNCSSAGLVLTPNNNDKYRAVVSGNDFRDMDYCISLYYGNATITANTFRNCVQAITGQTTANAAGQPRSANDVEVAGNFFSGYYALFLDNVRNWTVTGNTFLVTTSGYAPILLREGARDVMVTSNTFTLNNNPAVRMRTNANAVTFIGNIVGGSDANVGAVWAESTSANPLTFYMAGNNLSALGANYYFEVPGAVVGWNVFSSGTDSGSSPPALHPAGFVSGTIASANSMAISRGISVYRVSGTTTINTIAIPTGSGWQGPLVLIFDGALTVTEAGNIDLQGAASFNTTANDTLTLVYNGTKWYEMARSVN